MGDLYKKKIRMATCVLNILKHLAEHLSVCSNAFVVLKLLFKEGRPNKICNLKCDGQFTLIRWSKKISNESTDEIWTLSCFDICNNAGLTIQKFFDMH